MSTLRIFYLIELFKHALNFAFFWYFNLWLLSCSLDFAEWDANAEMAANYDLSVLRFSDWLAILATSGTLSHDALSTPVQSGGLLSV
jgi:hypothetical protein